MHDKTSRPNQPPVCDLVPGFAFYSNIGSGLAENLANLFEAIVEIAGGIARKPTHGTRADSKFQSRG